MLLRSNNSYLAKVSLLCWLKIDRFHSFFNIGVNIEAMTTGVVDLHLFHHAATSTWWGENVQNCISVDISLGKKPTRHSRGVLRGIDKRTCYLIWLLFCTTICVISFTRSAPPLHEHFSLLACSSTEREKNMSYKIISTQLQNKESDDFFTFFSLLLPLALSFLVVCRSSPSPPSPTYRRTPMYTDTCQ